MIYLIVYADVLIFLNFVVDYFLLSLTSKILNIKPKLFRVILGSIAGGLSSLYIFLPKQSTLLEFLFKIAVSMLLVIISFKYESVKHFFRSSVVLFLVTCGYGGVIFAVWLIFKPQGLVINNSQIYFNISPTILVLFSVIGYFAFIIFSKIFAKNSKFSEKCQIEVFAENKKIELTAIIDTGNSIEDPFGKSDIIITNKKQIELLFGILEPKIIEKLKARFRILPCSTVSGYDTLEGFRCDRAKIIQKTNEIIIDKPILAISKVKLDDGYNAIINPNILR